MSHLFFDKIVYLIHLELIDGSYSQVPTNVTSEEERKQDRTGEKRKKNSKLSGSGPLASSYARLRVVYCFQLLHNYQQK